LRPVRFRSIVTKSARATEKKAKKETMTNTNARDAMILDCETTYGVNALTCDPIVIEWIFGRMTESHGIEAARAALRAVNAKRERLGRIPAYPARLWA
jgi:hypothetical protein